ncbi:polyketide synthetase [Zopfia rhizophila CBS 207.26]|uniref:Polyketide synthetase n=1 Tax=Zopfia rhizophila CBS 207.26 TaxID=1314779 RepID=A0A6A6E419_9PEZI|nr:polyketide synthetase [Zopfia rhizophila CBS 207.26]
METAKGHRPNSRNEPIAIIGTACRFAGGCSSPSKFWELLRNPKDVQTPVPSDRFSAQGFYHHDGRYNGHNNVLSSYFLSENVRQFDAQFFQIKPVEANATDPQQRILLETVYESVEAAGLPIESLRGSNTAVYVGLMCGDYDTMISRDTDAIPMYHATGVARSIVSNRVSYFFDWHGPSMTIDTACSSSLVAVHQAVQVLRSGGAPVAVAAGSNLILGPEQYIAESKLKMLSPDGRSRMWDADANGYARGEGIAAIVLKTLSAALRDGDHVESLIIETGINQDGRTKGITMPNPNAQAALIRETYQKAGLNPSRLEDRCQFFEAHGTGTLAGDPVEAEAIHTAFFGAHKDLKLLSKHGDVHLHVGSVKTIIGHTGGTAGLAAVMKASLALQYGVIPRNLLFNKLNPSIEPFSQALRVPTSALDWPALPEGVPRRASANSFGFGGANAHAILESYDQFEEDGRTSRPSRNFVPFLFSAHSEKSLVAQLEAYSKFLKSNPSLNLRDLASTLACRRSQWPFKAAFAATTPDLLNAKIDEYVRQARDPSTSRTLTRSSSAQRKIRLGIFTGQGAQWAGMGRQLLINSEFARSRIFQFDQWLSELPREDRPSAVISQPVCTVIQILLVEILRQAGLEFHAVVGHSSGEIAAAYAAGLLSTRDTVYIAYYRGLYAHMARGVNSENDARQLCDLPYFKGRITVAANNSSASLVFEDERKFVRLLKVEKAYHSHHMLPCTEPYVDALSPSSKWFSSVTGERINIEDKRFGLNYWKDNMLQPVLFKEALTQAYTDDGPFDLAVEIGPHPTLQSPASHTLQELSEESIPYTGLLKRGVNDVEAIAHALDLKKYDSVMTGTTGFRVLKDLPTYCWDHDKEYWQESRQSRIFRSRGPVHELLGHLSHDSTDQFEIPWLHGHRLQAQTVFPAAAGDKAPKAIVISDLNIDQALAFNEDDTGTEILITVSDILREGSDTIQGTFMYHAALIKDRNDFSTLATCRLTIELGTSDEPLLLPRSPQEPYLSDIGVEQFYTSLLQVGYEYSGAFKALSCLRRKLGWATGMIASPDPNTTQSNFVIHPGMLDAAIQAVLLAHCYPEDGTLWSIHVPKSIKRVTMDLSIRPLFSSGSVYLPFDATATGNEETKLSGDVDLFDPAGHNTVLQIEGITCTPFSPAISKDDRKLFSYEVWTTAEPDAVLASSDRSATEDDYDLAHALERVAYFYMSDIHRKLPIDHSARTSPPYERYFDYMNQVLSDAPDDHHPYIKREWKQDTLEDITPLMRRYQHTTDLQVVRTVGEEMPRVLRGETTILEHLMKDDLLYRYYSERMGFSEHSTYLAKTVAQITNRYPHMSILEIGAGTGAATRDILRETSSKFKRYVFTDISKGYFDSARALFKEEVNKMTFRTLDIEADPTQQGFANERFDLIIASNVIHATEKLENTLRNVRSLLKPGGYLTMLEITDNGPIRFGFVFGSLPGWWLGAEDGRIMSPCISPSTWDAALRRTGFSGLDTITPQTHTLPYPGSGFVSQAIDDRVAFLRNPLSSKTASVGAARIADCLVVLGGASPTTADAIMTLEKYLGNFFGHIIKLRSLTQLDALEMGPSTAILSMTELDNPIFDGVTAEIFERFKAMFEFTELILWVTECCYDSEPYANMTVGFVRSQLRESPNVNFQFLDFGTSERINPSRIAEAFLKFCFTAKWKAELESDYLWSLEPEFAVRDSKTCILRLLENNDQNNRLNSSKRSIHETVNSTSSQVRLVNEGGSYFLERLHFPERQLKREDEILIQAEASFLSALNIEDKGSLFLTYGLERDCGKPTLCLSQSIGTIVQAPRKWLLHSVALFTMVLSVLQKLHSNGRILVLDPSPRFATILSRVAMERDIQVTYATSSPRVLSRGSMYIHPRTPGRVLEDVVPTEVSVFLDFADTANGQRTSRLLRKYLRPCCRYEDLGCLVSKASRTSGLRPSDTAFWLDKAIQFAISSLQNPLENFGVNELSAQQVVEGPGSLDPFSVLKWKSSSQMMTTIHPIDALPLFKNDRSYWLVGLTQTLGLSLCEWMVRKGARYLVLSSRNPRLDQQWLDKMRGLGATIKCLANDVSDKRAVKVAYAEIRRDLPPVAGIAQGAMVLRDTLAKDMTLENLQSVLNPKVQGSINLDSVFRDEPLDFFVFFSSMAGIVGNLGQCNYTAANAFMSTLAAQRRKRGLAASVIHIGAILGAGYVTQQLSQTFRQKLKEGGHTWMSERAFHQVFAEGVLASNPHSTEPWQICTGLRHFSHQIIFEASTDIATDSSDRNSLPIKTQLAQATGREQVYKIIKTQFLVKLRSVLQVEDKGGLMGDSMLTQHLDGLGIDSLIAVDLRTWFMNNIGINVPVLKILGGVSVQELIEFAVENLPQELKGNVAHDISTELQPEEEPLPAERASINGSSDPEDESTPKTLSMTSSGLKTPATSDDEEGCNESTIGDIESCKTEDDRLNEPYKRTYQRSAPLSHSQSLFWFASMFLDDRSSLNHSGAYRIRGNIRVADLKRALDAVAQRHEILRTAFYHGPNGDVVQGIMDKPFLELEVGVIITKADVMNNLYSMRNEEFDLQNGRAMRIMLLSLTRLDHFLLISCHPIALDGTSLQVFLADLERAYDRRLPLPVLQFSDFATRQNAQQHNKSWESSLHFWTEEFTTSPTPLNLFSFSKQKARRVLQSYSIRREDFRINASLNSRIRRLCSQYQTTPFHFYTTIFRILLFRFSEQDDICIGTADANRTNHPKGAVSAIGPYVNLVPLRFTGIGKTSFFRVLQATRQKVLAALEHSSFPFEVLLTELGVPCSATHSPLFQSFVDYRQGAREKQPFSDCELEVLDFDAGKNGYDLGLDIIDTRGSECLVMILTQELLYGRDEAELISASYQHLLNSFVEDPSVLVSDVDIFPPSARQAALDLGKVVVYQRPSSDYICSLLAVLRIGAVYIPFDAEMPLSRLVQMATDSRITAIVADKDTIVQAQDLRVELSRDIDIVDVSNLSSFSHPSPILARSDVPAAVLYTSGTTGKSKGIVLSHANLRNEIEHSELTYGIEREIVLQQSSLGFDMSLPQIFSALAFGGRLYIVPQHARKDPIALSQLIAQEQISFTGATPSEYMTWLNHSNFEELKKSRWKIAISGGEIFPHYLRDRFHGLALSNFSIYNAYGPTETTCSAARAGVALTTTQKVVHVSAGVPAPNASVYILDDNRRPVPIGVPGEIFIGGAGVALGYMDDKTTKERFIPNHFTSEYLAAKGWNTMYRTGDVGRWSSEGTMSVEGRVSSDTQIKLRGLRIDLQEVERAIVDASDRTLQEAVASIRATDSDGIDLLVAHVLPSPAFKEHDLETSLDQLRSKLPLPQYMCPAIIIPLDCFPRTGNGKVDRKSIQALPFPNSRLIPTQELADLTRVEGDVLQMWKEVLPNRLVTQISPQIDFFQLGGSSMHLIRLQSMMRQRWNRTLALYRLFEKSTLRGMASLIDNVVGTAEHHLDWEAESEIPPGFYQATEDFPTVAVQSDVQRVVLTGASGFVGQGILRRLLQDEGISKVHCIAVRNMESMQAFADNPAVEIHVGDLRKPDFGLSTAELFRIFNEADAIIHNGADVSHMESYRTLKSANFESTKQLLKLALPRRIPFHFVSTAGVALLSGLEEFHESSVAPYRPPSTSTDGYTVTKWCSERLLEKASEQYEISVWIHRPSSIRRKKDPGLDILQNLLEYIKITRTVPESDSLKGYFDVVYLSTVVDRIVKALSRETTSRTTYVNHSGDMQFPFCRLRSILVEREGWKDLQTMDMESWITKAEAAGMNALIAGVLRKMVARGESVRFPKLIKSEV